MGAAGRRSPRFVSARRRLSVVGLVAVAVLALVASACSRTPPSASESSGSIAEDPSTGTNTELLDRSDTGDDPDRGDETDVDSVEDDGEPAQAATFVPAPDGYLVWAHAVEPANLSVIDPVNGGLFTTSWIREGLLEGLYRVDSEWEQVPELLAGDASLVVNDNQSVSITYKLRPGLTWSDGEPLTASDVEYTHEILLEGCLKEADGSAIDVSNDGCVYPMADRTGYDLVTSFSVVDGTTFTVTMAAFYPDWRSLYPQIFAAHSFGDDAAAVAANLETMIVGGRPLPSSGPLVLQNWVDHTMRLEANERYHGASSSGGSGSEEDDGGSEDTEVEGVGAVDGVQINFVSDPRQAVAAVGSGEADLAIVGSDLDLLDDLESTVSTVGLPAVEFEHLGLNLLNPHLADPLIREAVARAVSRSDLVSSTYGDLIGDGISADGVGNMFWLPGQSGYEDHQSEAVSSDADGAIELIEQAGYVRTGDGSFRHPDRGTLFLRFTTNSGDSVRVALQEELTEQLIAAGFEIRADNRRGGAYLTEGPFSAEAMEASGSGGLQGRSDIWDMVLFGWAGGPWPGLQSGAFRANSGANPYGYANPEFDTESSRCDGLADDAERESCYQDLDLFVTTLDQGDDGLFVVPLVERPQVLVYNTERLAAVPSMVDGPTGGPLPDVGGFSFR